MSLFFRLAIFSIGGYFSSLSSAGDMKEEEITVTSYDQTPLSGTLTTPSAMRALFITLHGSFLQTRDGDLDSSAKWMFPQGVPKRRLFLDMASRLGPQGIGSFRFDKRASGKSGGDYAQTDLMTLARDASVVLQDMRRRFPNTPIGFIGQSEGSLVALKEFQVGARPDFLVLTGPSLAPLPEFLEFQKTRAAAPYLNDTDGSLGRRMPYLKAFYHAMYHGNMLDQALNTKEPSYTLRLGDWSHVTSLQKYREYGWNGFELLDDVTVPTFLIVGAEDNNVPLAPVQRVISAKAKGRFANVNVSILPGLEHSFREVAPGDTFVDIMAKPVSPRFLEKLESVFGSICEIKLSTPVVP